MPWSDASGSLFQRSGIIKAMLLSMILLPNIVFGQETCSICKEADYFVGRPYEAFEAAAYCSYSTFHPSEYLTDNNWDILCAFIEPGGKEKLDSLDISWNKSQLRLLEVGELLTSNNGIYSTTIPIFEKSETRKIRQESKEFADSIFPIIEPEIKQLIAEYKNAGYSKQIFSLIFSYLLDGYIWGEDKLPSPERCGEHGTWSGGFWAMYEPRNHVKIGTNGYGPLHHTWTDDLKYWLGSRQLIAFAKEVMANTGKQIESQELIEKVKGWGLTDEKGNVLVPIMISGCRDRIDTLCDSIATKLSVAVKAYCKTWSRSHNITSEDLAQVIFYHEVLWDLLDILESQGLISTPPILKGEKVGNAHFGDICFIVLNENND